MEKIKYGDIVVSMIGQFTSDNKCWIDAGFVSKAMTNENDEESSQVIWFNETTTGYGHYPVENFRLATDKEAKEYREIGYYTINTEKYKYFLNYRVGTAYGMGQIIALKEGVYSEHYTYLVSLDHAPPYAHNGNGDSLLIGQYGEKNNCVWVYEGSISYNNGLPPTTPVTGTYSSSLAPSGSFSTTIGALSGTVQTYGYGVSGLAGHSTLGSSVGFPGYIGINQYPIKTTGSESYKDAPNETMVQSMLFNKEDVKHQDAIILKSKTSKRKLITI